MNEHLVISEGPAAAPDYPPLRKVIQRSQASVKVGILPTIFLLLVVGVRVAALTLELVKLLLPAVH